MPPSTLVRALLCLLAAAAATAAATARAGDGRVAVVALDTPPELTFMGKSVAEELARSAAREGRAVLGPAEVEAKLGRAATADLVRCADDARCLASKAAPLGVERVVGGWLRRRGESYRVALVHADARTGERLGGVEREVPVASRRLQRDVAAAAPALLGGDVEATGVLAVTTVVPGATVTIDGAAVGATPLAHAVRPGRHKVHVSAAGFQDATPVWVDVPASGRVEHRPRLYPIPARDRPNRSASEGSGTRVELFR